MGKEINVMTPRRKAIGIFSIAAIVFFSVVAAFTPSASATDVYSGGSIQAAINAATPGEIITVHDGTYNENLVVNKSDIVIQSANGPAVTIISSNQTDMHVVNITDQTNVTLEGFTIRDASGTSPRVAGIYMVNATECMIANNVITNISVIGPTNWAYGISLSSGSDNNMFSSTTVSCINATHYVMGISLSNSDNNTFSSTTSVSHLSANLSVYGFRVGSCSANKINSSLSLFNLSSGHNVYGISMEFSFNNEFTASTIRDIKGGTFAYGVQLYDGCKNNTLSATSVFNLTATDGAYGIWLSLESDNNTFIDTSVANLSCESAYGVYLDQSDNNAFNDTAVSSLNAANKAHGIHLIMADNNTFDPTIIEKVTAQDFSVGIYSNKSNSNNFSDTNISAIIAYEATGIDLDTSHSNRFKNTIIIDAGGLGAGGIRLINSHTNSFLNTTIIDVGGMGAGGIGLTNSHDNRFTNTHIRDIIAEDHALGVSLQSSHNNSFFDFTITEITSGGYTTAYGVYMVESSINVFSGGKIYSTGEPRIDYAVWLENCTRNTINESEIRDNGHGFWLNQSDNNTIERNMIVNNTALPASGLSLSTGSDNNEVHENCFYYNGYELYQAWDDGDRNNLDRNYWQPPPGLILGDPYRISGDAMNRDHHPLSYCPLCAVEAPAFTPTGLIALVSLLSAIAAVAIVRKRR